MKRKIDLEAHYREQDRRMNLPDDDFDEYFDEYLHRMGVKRRLPLPEAPSTTDTSAVVHKPTQKKEDVLAPQKLDETTDEIKGDLNSGAEIRSQIPEARLRSGHRESAGEDKVNVSEKESSLPSKKRRVSPNPSNQLTPRAPTPALPVVLHDSVPQGDGTSVKSDNIGAKISPSRRLKRKLSGDIMSNAPAQKQPAVAECLSRSTPAEEIALFIACPKIRRSSPVIKPILREKPGGKAPKASGSKRNIPPLDLQPIAPPHRSALTVADVPALDQATVVQGAETCAAPSKRSVEVKERIAQHATTKRTDAVVKHVRKLVTSTPTEIIDESSLSVACVSSLASGNEAAPSVSKKVPLNNAVNFKSKAARKGKVKEKPGLVTRLEYALKLQDKIAALAAKSTKPKSLTGLAIFYIGGDMTYASERTRNRMDLIVKHGGTLIPEFDPSVVTHIITDAPEHSTLRELKLKRLSDIPEHIPTVTWKWILARFGKGYVSVEEAKRVRDDTLWMHTAFVERMDAGVYPAPTAKRGDTSNISDFTNQWSIQNISEDIDSETEDLRQSEYTTIPEAPPVPPQGRVEPSASKKWKEDPLEEFYAKARAQQETAWSRHAEDEDESEIEIEDVFPQKPQKRGWTCDKKEVPLAMSANQDIIDKLEELKGLHEAKPTTDDRWRAFTYQKCISALRNYPKRIKSFAEARSIRGIGEKTAEKIMEIINTGELRRIQYEKTDDVEVTRLFQGIYGAGRSTAYQWYSAGCRTLQDLVRGKNGVKLSMVQEIGVTFYDDINDRMPRAEAREIFELIKPIALKIDSRLFVEIMGSYRRGKSTCGDIDIIITRPTDDGKTHKGVIARLLQELHAVGILTEDLALPEDPDNLEATYRGLCRVPREGSRRRRIDFLAVPWKCRGAALLYYTGDDIFNRAIRMKANIMGYSLNQRGLFGGVVRDPHDRRVKLNEGYLVASETEQEIFEALKVPWQEPHERVRR